MGTSLKCSFEFLGQCREEMLLFFYEQGRKFAERGEFAEGVINYGKGN